jgi:cell volume regulation protein A
VATIAVAGLAYGLSELIHGSGLLAVYLTALAMGSANLPARRIIVSFHEGVGWIAQISLFILLGLLVFPGSLGDVALKGLALSAALILVARPVATFLATALGRFDFRERLMLGWAGLRGATPIWLATFPVVAGIRSGEEEFAIVFFVVVTSTLVQGASFEPLAKRLGLTTDEPALPQRLLESGRIRQMGGDVVAFRLPPGAAAAGHPVRELELPREALVNVIVRDGHAIPPRGSTVLEEGDELHVLVRGELRDEVEEQTKVWVDGPIGKPPPPPLPRRAASQVFSVRPARAGEDPTRPEAVDGVAVVAVLRSRRDGAGVMVALADGRYAVTGEDVVAIGGRRSLADWCEGRAEREGLPGEEQAWWQEVTGALIARGRRR